MASERLDTAHQVWDRWWKDARTRVTWSEPESVVTERFELLRERGARRVADVGAGVGRHAIAYAAAGFDVVAMDASDTGLSELRSRAAVEGLSIETHRALFTAVPLANASVDHVLSWNVLYHGDRDIAAAAFAECRRVVRDGGTFQFTMLSKRNRACGVGDEIRPDTFVDETSTDDKDHPHLYLDAASLTTLAAAAGFEILSMVDVDQRPPGAWHWTVFAEARPAAGSSR